MGLEPHSAAGPWLTRLSILIPKRRWALALKSRLVDFLSVTPQFAAEPRLLLAHGDHGRVLERHLAPLADGRHEAALVDGAEHPLERGGEVRGVHVRHGHGAAVAQLLLADDEDGAGGELRVVEGPSLVELARGLPA